MSRDRIEQFVGAVTRHNRLVLLVMLVLTGVMAVGATQVGGGQAGGTTEMFPGTTVSEKADYVGEQYSAQESGEQRSPAVVYVRPEDGNALSKETLLASLRYQREVLGNESVAGALRGDPTGVANLVAQRAAGDTDASLDAQIDALEAASQEAVASLVASTTAEHSRALALLPERFEPGTASAESHRTVFQFAAGEDGQPPSDAQRVLYEAAAERDDFFTLGEHATARGSQQLNANTMQLVVPFALLSILAVLAFTYRDVVDVVVGMVGVVVSIVWLFGILGWLGVGAGMTMIVGPVLIGGLSIDFGFHVFTRYREERGPDEGVRAPMARATRSVALALALVTATAGVGFLSNLANPVGSIRDLGVGITLGVVAAFVIFVTLVPALKVGVDGLLERAGVDRRTAPLGDSAVLRPVLAGSVTLARRAAPLVVVVALVASAGGAAAWTALDEESFQQQTEPAAEWKQDLPGPVAWEEPTYQRNSRYVRGSYSAVAGDESERFQILVEGDVTDGESLAAVAAATDRPVFADGRSRPSLASPVAVIDSVAEQDDAFARTVADADTDGDGVPDTDLRTVYDRLYELAPQRASQVVERTDGDYRSLRIVGPAESAGVTDDRVDDVRAAAAAIESADADLTATAVSQAAILESQLDVVTDGIVRVLVLALGAVFVGLVAIFRRVHGSATLGVTTVVPILMVTGLVVGGMYLLDVPLTLVTALLMSLVVGLGVDYNIHVGDRFAQELDGGCAPLPALERAVTGTGGALFGSTLTSAGAFAALLLHPHPQLRSFGVLVVLTLVAAFVVSVFVLPSLLVLWSRHVAARTPTGRPAVDGVARSGDD